MSDISQKIYKPNFFLSTDQMIIYSGCYFFRRIFWKDLRPCSINCQLCNKPYKAGTRINAHI
ncbi:hypothetical protein BpHYR1_001051 [Brachionus plicatilis]|uniref:Uncharacterized protein n=1 Tax=Brachionus plicatilis TaxID=10195 RepID=A0A3M7QCR6_BRAPC|nr:hypothetical protein BpHYR1_001051 [Brachionus plicatilis]